MQFPHEKARPLRLLILDVDGVLTSGMIFYGQEGTDELKGFHIHDGLGIQCLQKTGVTVAVISGKKSQAVFKRLADLGIQHAYLGYDDKLPPYEELKQKLNLSDAEVGYMGDDLPDLPLLRRAGLAITVPNATAIVKQNVDYITENQCGAGAVREVCEFIMETQGTYQSMIQSYLTK